MPCYNYLPSQLTPDRGQISGSSNGALEGHFWESNPGAHHLDDSASCAPKEPSIVVRLLWMSDLEANYICCTSELVVLSGMAENSGRRKKNSLVAARMAF